MAFDMGKLKYKYIIALFLIGLAGRILGALLKITHAPNADCILTISSFLMIISLVIGIIKMIATKDKKSFLNQ